MKCSHVAESTIKCSLKRDVRLWEVRSLYLIGTTGMGVHMRKVSKSRGSNVVNYTILCCLIL